MSYTAYNIKPYNAPQIGAEGKMLAVETRGRTKRIMPKGMQI
jgi:hypothetical protein